MQDYKDIKIKHGNRVSQTLDQPVMILEFWEFDDLVLSVAVFMFGALTSAWVVSGVGLVITAILIPNIKKKYPKGILFHWPYRNLGMSLPGLVNPRVSKNEKRKFSD